MSKLPAFQFYPGDWLQDTRPLSLAAKGAWIDLLCAMWRSQTRGSITLPMVGYSRLIGATVDQANSVIKELTDMHICDSVTLGNGDVTLQCRRMMREEKERESICYRVQRHRNASMKRTCNENVTVPSSASASSSSSKSTPSSPPLPSTDAETLLENAKPKTPDDPQTEFFKGKRISIPWGAFKNWVSILQMTPFQVVDILDCIDERVASQNGQVENSVAYCSRIITQTNDFTPLLTKWKNPRSDPKKKILRYDLIAHLVGSKRQ